jgi:hypothetical protein
MKVPDTYLVDRAFGNRGRSQRMSEEEQAPTIVYRGYLGFNTADLAANRQGWLSDRQLQPLSQTKIPIISLDWKEFLPTLLIIAFYSLIFVLITRIWIFFFIIISLLSIIALIIFGSDLLRQLSAKRMHNRIIFEKRVWYVEGQITESQVNIPSMGTGPGYPGTTSACYIIGDQTFRIPYDRSGTDWTYYDMSHRTRVAFNGAYCRLYFLRSGAIVGIEALETPD